MTKAQQNILKTFKAMPAYNRHQNRAGAPIRWEVVDCYDYRSMLPLMRSGALITSDHGVLVTDHVQL